MDSNFSERLVSFRIGILSKTNFNARLRYAITHKSINSQCWWNYTQKYQILVLDELRTKVWNHCSKWSVTNDRPLEEFNFTRTEDSSITSNCSFFTIRILFVETFDLFKFDDYPKLSLKVSVCVSAIVFETIEKLAKRRHTRTDNRCKHTSPTSRLGYLFRELSITRIPSL